MQRTEACADFSQEVGTSMQSNFPSGHEGAGLSNLFGTASLVRTVMVPEFPPRFRATGICGVNGDTRSPDLPCAWLWCGHGPQVVSPHRNRLTGCGHRD